MHITGLYADLCEGYSHDTHCGFPAPDWAGPDDLQFLRFNGSEIVDVRDHTDWLIDEFGRKRLPAMHPDSKWQSLVCALDAELTKDDNGWRAKTEAEKALEVIELNKQKVRTEIDVLSSKLTAGYTGTEEKGWIAMLAEAKAFVASNDAADAPGLALDAAIRGDTVANRAAAVLGVAQVTGIIPSLASGMRARAEVMIEATDGDSAKIAEALSKLRAIVNSILEAMEARDKNRIVTLATSNWDA